MFFPDHEKLIYAPPGFDTKLDPLAVDRALRIASNGTLAGLLSDWQSASDGLGDISQGSTSANDVLSARAEETLVRVAREAFGLPPFPDCTDGVALEVLCDYLEWMAGKGKRGESPQT